MSVADILAAARGKGGSSAAKPAPAPAKKEPAAEGCSRTSRRKHRPRISGSPQKPRAGEVKSMKNAFKTVDEIVAYCRKVDAK